MTSPPSPVDGDKLCLICNSRFEWKPVLRSREVAENEFSAVGFLQNLKSAFLLLCKLLLADVEGSGEHVQLLAEMFEATLSHPNSRMEESELLEECPCCHKCYQGIMEVWKLQNLIKETMEIQGELVGNLRRSLVARRRSGRNIFSGDDDLGLIVRNQLVKRLAVRTRTTNLKDVSNDNSAAKISPSSIKRKRKLANSFDHLRSSEPTKFDMKTDDETESTFKSISGIPSPRKVGRPRKSELVQAPLPSSSLPIESEDALLEDGFNRMTEKEDDDPDPEWEASSPESDMSDRRSEVHTNSESDEQIPERVARTQGRGRPRKCPPKDPSPALLKRKVERPPKTKLERTQRDAESTTVPNPSERSGRPRKEISKKSVIKAERRKNANYFYIMNKESLLILKNNAIKFYFNERLECLEEGCAHVVPGTDKSSLEQMRTHVTTISHFDKNGKRQQKKCPICSEQVSILKTHMFERHSPAQTLCEICWKPLKYPHPNIHLWTHKNEEERKAAIASGDKYIKCIEGARRKNRPLSFICSQCGTGCISQSHLRRHEEIHLPEYIRRKHQCDYCGANFLTDNTLKLHIARMHKPDSDLRKLVCRICNKTFQYRDKSLYKYHMRTHLNEKPFVCELCGKGFAKKSLLTTHSVVHGTQKFKCEFCGQEFKHRRGMRCHQVKVHRDRVTVEDPEEAMKKRRLEDRPDFIGPRLMYPCEVCEKVFPLRCRMTKHVQTHHSHLYATLILGKDDLN